MNKTILLDAEAGEESLGRRRQCFVLIDMLAALWKLLSEYELQQRKRCSLADGNIMLISAPYTNTGFGIHLDLFADIFS